MLTKPISVTIIANKNTLCDPNVIAFANSVFLVGAGESYKYFSIPPVKDTNRDRCESLDSRARYSEEIERRTGI